MYVNIANEARDFIVIDDPYDRKKDADVAGSYRQVPSVGLTNRFIPRDLCVTADGDYNDLFDQQVFTLSGATSEDKSLVSTLAGNDPYYHNYYTGLKIFTTNNTNKTNFIASFSSDHKKIIDYDKMFTAITSEIKSVLTSLSISTDITLYLPQTAAIEVISDTQKDYLKKLINNFNAVPSTPIHLVNVFCDYNTVTDASFSYYKTYQPASYNGIYDTETVTWGHGKHSDFRYIG
jgi:hypothetical protein